MNDLETKKVGRKPKYTYEQLKEVLQIYIEETLTNKIVLTQIAKYTGIPRHYWRFNKKIREDIERFNNMENEIYMVENSELSRMLPNIEELVNNHYENKSKLIWALKGYQQAYERVFEDACKYDKILLEKEKNEKEWQEKLKNLEFINKKFKSENVELKEEIKKLQKNIDYYETKLLSIANKSESPKLRAEEGIKENIVSLKTNKNKEKIKANIDDFENYYEGLFD